MITRMMIGIMLLFMIGCGGTDKSPTEPSKPEKVTKHKAPKVTSASVGGATATVTSNGKKSTASAKVHTKGIHTSVVADKPAIPIPDSGYSDKPTNKPTTPSKPSRGHGVIVSQDIHDEDNFSIVRAAINMHQAGYINLLAITVTGKDTLGKGGLLFSVAGKGKHSILINHNNPKTRITNASGRYKNLDHYPSDDLLDSQRDDSSLQLESILENYPGSVSYIVGGHLHNFADILRRNPDLVNAKIDQLVIDTGWSSRTSGDPEMNLSQGTTNTTGTSEATIYVFKHFKGKILISSDPYAKWTDLNIGILGSDTGLFYLTKNGRYSNGKTFNMADFPALFYGGIGNTFNGNPIGTEVQTCFDLTTWGALMAKPGKCNRFYIENSNNNAIETFFKKMIKE